MSASQIDAFSVPFSNFNTGKYVIVDLELTCWPGSLAREWSSPGEYREIVQLGFISFLYDSATRIIRVFSEDEFCFLPRFNPVLSRYFIDLTGITNEFLARNAVSLEPVLLTLATIVQDSMLLANGGDISIINENICLYSLSVPPFSGGDISSFLASSLGIAREDCVSSCLLDFVDGPFDDLRGPAHQALHDCRSILIALAALLSARILH